MRQKNFKISNRNNIEFINDTVSSGYAEDRQYSEKWKNLHQDVNTNTSVFVRYSHLVAMFLVVVGLYLVFSKIFEVWQESQENRKFSKSVRSFQKLQPSVKKS
jgi:hypothetical protein